MNIAKKSIIKFIKKIPDDYSRDEIISTIVFNDLARKGIHSDAGEIYGDELFETPDDEKVKDFQ